MARQSTNRIEFEGSHIVWRNRVTGAVWDKFDTASIAPAIRDRVLMHGAKQIINDAYTAGGEAGMAGAMEALILGTWGQKRSGLPAARVFAACVALGHFADTDDTRAKWRELKEPQREALREREDVREWLAAHPDESAASAAATVLAGF